MASTTTSDAFDKLLNKLADDVVHAQIFYTLHQDLRSAAPTYKHEMNNSRAFWNVTFRGLIEGARIRLIRIYDQTPKTLSLPNFLKTISNSPHFFTKEEWTRRSMGEPTRHVPLDMKDLRQDSKLVSMSDTTVARFIRNRHSTFAHLSAKSVLLEVEDESRILTFGDLDILLDRAHQIINKYGGLFKGHRWSAQLVGGDDFKYVLKALKYYRDAQNERD